MITVFAFPDLTASSADSRLPPPMRARPRLLHSGSAKQRSAGRRRFRVQEMRDGEAQARESVRRGVVRLGCDLIQLRAIGGGDEERPLLLLNGTTDAGVIPLAQL